MAVLTPYLPAFFVWFLIRHVLSLPGARWLFSGQVLYYHEESLISKQPAAQNEKLTKAQKKAVERAKRLGTENDQVRGLILNNNIIGASVYSKSGAYPLSDDVEVMVPLYMVAFATFAWHVLAIVLGHGGFLQIALMFCLVIPVVVCMSLLRAEFGGEVRSILERWHLVPLALACGGLTLALFMFAPPSIIDFKLEAAAADWDKFMNIYISNTLKARLGYELGVGQGRTDPFFIAAAVAVCAGIIGALLHSCAARAARFAHQSTMAPYWLADAMPTSRAVQYLMLAPVPLALCVALSQFKPLTAWMGLTPAAVTTWYPLLLAVTVVTMLLAARPLVTAHFHSGIVSFGLVKFQNAASQRRTQLLAATLKANAQLMCKAAVQIMGPAMLLTALLFALVASDGTLGRLPTYPVWPGAAARLNATAAASANATQALLNATSSAVPAAPSPAPGGVVELEGGLEGVTLPLAGHDAPADAEGGRAGDLEIDGTVLEGMDDHGAQSAGVLLMRSITNTIRNAGGVYAPAQLFAFLATYLSWFACVAWGVYVYGWLAVYRLGLHIAQ